LGHLDKRSFGLLLLLGLLVIVPGVATIATLMVTFPSAEMLLGRSRPTFPRFPFEASVGFHAFQTFYGTGSALGFGRSSI
jgi:hypothetical protein